MKGPLFAIAAGAGVFALVAASAASMNATGTVPQVGFAVECQNTPVTVSTRIEGGLVRAVTVGGISRTPETCGGKRVGVSLYDGGSRIRASTVPVQFGDGLGARTVSFNSNGPLNSPVSPTFVTRIDVVIADDIKN